MTMTSTRISVATGLQYPPTYRPTYIPRDPRTPLQLAKLPCHDRPSRKPGPQSHFNIQLHVQYWTQPHQVIARVGQNENWNPTRGLKFNRQFNDGTWTLQLPSYVRDTLLEFKLVLVDDSTESVTWESGQNRLMSVPLNGAEDYFLSWH